MPVILFENIGKGIPGLGEDNRGRLVDLIQEFGPAKSTNACNIPVLLLAVSNLDLITVKWALGGGLLVLGETVDAERE